MASLINRSTLVLLLAAACGPGTNTTDSGSTSDTASSTATSGTGDASTAGTTDTPTTDTPTTAATTTTDATVNPTGVTNTTTDATATDPTATTGSGVCPDVFPQDGDPCDSEGLTCGGPCEDPCAFCNISRCEGGVWTQLEVFPADCLDCDTVCTFVLPAACNAGPPDQAACVAGCMAAQSGPCGLQYNQALACIGSMPTFTCTEAGQPTVITCSDQFDALYQCLG